MLEKLSAVPDRATKFVAESCIGAEQIELPFAEFRAPRLAPTYAGEPIAEFCNARQTAQEIVAESKKWMPGLASALWKPKPSSEVHDRIGGDAVASLRTCYAWCAGTNEPMGFVLVKLLRSDAGWRVFEYLMRGSTQPWWRDLQAQRRLGAAVMSVMAKSD